jgi:CheY-like chemotaxis protein
MIPSTVQIVFRDDAPGAVVEGDATQLQQLLLNLCSNAEYAMRATNGGTLTVQARWEDHAPVTAVRLSVTDTGVGIPAEVRARMFEPFFTTKPVGEGTGLGLSVLHGIVGAHGGTIAVTSELGHGSTFDVVLPARHADQAVSHEPPVMAPAAAATRRILLVDDEPAVMKAVQRTLQRRGYEVETASNGAEALERLRTRQGIDLVITDQTMPVMTGTELIEQLRADGLTVPVILASGFGAAVDRVRNEGSGDVWRMDKPFATEELLAMVSRAMAGDATAAGSAPASPPPSV